MSPLDRFSLLLLEPGEIYFEDFSVTLYRHPEQPDRDPDAFQGSGSGWDPVSGRLKICSKSLVFVPTKDEDLARPLIKLPFSECIEIQEWLPRSFQSRLARERHLLSCLCSSYVEMMSHNRMAPFKFPRQRSLFVFALRLGKLDDYLPQIGQLFRASTLPPVEQNGMIAAIVYSRQNRLRFDACWMESVQEQVLLRTTGNKITPLVVNPGRILLTNVILYFQAYNNAEATPVIKVRLDNIKRIFQRRYLLRPLGLEIDYVNQRGKSAHIYLTFNKPEDRQKLYHRLISQPALTLEDVSEDNMTLQWQNGLISNFDYLLYLNSAADRSFNDLTQYPVFPWVVSDYVSEKLDLTSPLSFRDLSKPMGALDPDRLESLRQRTADMPEPRFLYGSHYSTPGFVLYFLVRKIPECMLCLQNGRFDHPDRMFNSIPQTWVNVTTHHSDFKELVPEFYMTEHQGDFLQNAHAIDFGVRHCGRPVADVELPPWAKTPADFVRQLREALESEYVSRNLHKWIDLIFGYKQRGKEAEQADNVFYHLCYEGSVDLDSINDLEKRYALEVQIGEFGQVPKQLFTSPHPQKAIPGVSPSPKKTGSDGDGVGGVGGLSNGSQRNLLQSFNSLTDSVVKYWRKDVGAIRMFCDYKVHKESLSAVSISVDKLWIFSASHDSVLKMYSLDEMQVLRNISVASHITLSCCFPLPNNKTVLLGSKDNNLCSYSIEYGRTSDYLAIHRDAISCMDWRSGILATGSWDCSVRLWHCNELNGYKVRLGTDLVSQLEHNSQVTCLHICPDNSQLVTGTRDGSVVLWCLASHNIIQELPAHRRQVNAVKFSPDGTRVVSCGSDFFLKVIDLKTGSILFSKNLNEELNCLAWDGRTVLLGGGTGYLSLWDLHRGTPISRLPAHNGPMTALSVSEDGDVVVTGGEDRRVIVWKTGGGDL